MTSINPHSWWGFIFANNRKLVAVKKKKMVIRAGWRSKMFEANYHTQYSEPQTSSSPIEQAAKLLSAVEMFNRSRMQATVERIKRFFSKQESSLEEAPTTDKIAGKNFHYAGLQTVSLDQIDGSLGRTNDFDKNFNPLADYLRDRWIRVALARENGIALDPVRLVQIGDHYFVEDGHHRISVAHARGERNIDAEIIIWETSIQHSWK